jgi:glucans biosynthesis protein C
MKRRHDMDWVRVIAIALLIIYHTAIGFQPWGGFIGFITNAEYWQALWTPMTMLNIWRIPLLFYVSGMGLYLAIQNRNWKQLFAERFLRIGVPLLFGSLLIVPIHWYLLQYYYKRDIAYLPNLGHLWFLGNILLYVLVLSPLFYFFKHKSEHKIAVLVRESLRNPLCLAVVTLFFVAESLILKPAIFEMYAYTLHGLVWGMLAFVFGFLFMVGGDPFWKMLQKWRWVFVAIATALFVLRYGQMPAVAPAYLLAIESNGWIFAVMAFAYTHLNKESRPLTYLKEAAYPVYILHMAFLFLGSTLLFPLKIGAEVKFVLLVLFTLAGSLACYELIIRRFNAMRMLFGLKKK